MSDSKHQDTFRRLIEHYFDHAAINNVHRAAYVECLVDECLGKEWIWEGAWEYWDFRHVSEKTKLEIKQSAARQAWDVEDDVPRKSRSFYLGKKRRANIYIFAWHGQRNKQKADQRELDQWRFLVVPTGRLPETQQSIGLRSLQNLAEEVGHEELQSAVNQAVAECAETG